MSSEPIAGYKRSAHDAPDTSDPTTTALNQDQPERQRNKKLRRDGEARNLSGEER